MKAYLRQCMLALIWLWLPVLSFAIPVSYEINGVNDVIGKNIIERLNGQWQNISQSNLSNKTNVFIKKSSSIVRKAIAPFGYLKPQINKKIKKNHQGLWIIFHVHLGAPTRISHMDIRIIGEGANKKIFQRILKHNPLHIGDVLEINQYNHLSDRMYSTASAHGYFQARMTTKKIIINQNTHTARITLLFNTHQRSLFGITHFSRIPLSLKFIRRYLRFRPGEPYKQHKLEELQQGLADSNYFNQVVVTPEVNHAHNHIVPIKVHLSMNKNKQYRVGLGYGTDTGPRITLGANYRHINRYGHKLNLAARISKLSNGLMAKYTIPGRHPDTSEYTINAGYDRQNISAGKSNAQKIGISYTTLIKGITQTISLTMLRERYNLSHTPTINAHMLMPSIEWSKLHSNHMVSPSKGYRISLRLSAASKAVISKASFFQALLNVHWLQSFFDNRTRLLLRGTAGYTKIKDLESLPLSLQLLAGGSRSIRGFDYNSLGPGSILSIGSVELQQRFYKKFYLVGFFDAGRIGLDCSVHVTW